MVPTLLIYSSVEIIIQLWSNMKTLFQATHQKRILSRLKALPVATWAMSPRQKPREVELFSHCLKMNWVSIFLGVTMWSIWRFNRMRVPKSWWVYAEDGLNGILAWCQRLVKSWNKWRVGPCHGPSWWGICVSIWFNPLFGFTNYWVVFLTSVTGLLSRCDFQQ